MPPVGNKKQIKDSLRQEKDDAAGLLHQDQTTASELLSKNTEEAASLLRENRESAAELLLTKEPQQIQSPKEVERVAEVLQRNQEVTAQALRTEQEEAAELLGQNQEEAAELLGQNQEETSELLYQSEAIIENSKDAIIGTTLDGIITRWNGGAERMFGYTAEEVVGKSGSVLYPPEMWVLVPALLAKMMNKEAIGDYDIDGLKKDGTRIYMSISISPVVTSDGVVVGASVVERDISERKRVEQSLLQIQSVVENSSDGIFGATLDGLILSWNGGAQKMLGYSAAEIIGESASILLAPERLEDLARFIGMIKRKESITGYDSFTIRKDGTKLDTSASISPVLDKDGNPVSVAVVLRDITERRKAEQHVVELNEIRDKFIQIISHQLRTPLTAINWNLEMLLGGDFGKMEETQRKFLQATHASSVEITRRIHSLLAAMDVEEGRTLFTKEEVPIGTICIEVVNEMQGKAGLRNLSLSYTPQTEEFPIIMGDGDKIRIALTALIENAIDYTKEGGNISVSLTSAGGVIHFEVRDTGVGIPEPEQHRVFTRFFRASNSSVMRTDAFGLGLFLVKYFIEQHQGKIGFESKLGEGSTFWFEIPTGVA